MAPTTDYYQILSLEGQRHDKPLPDELVRLAYKRALLAFHPDKQNASARPAAGNVPSVDEIAVAYKTLADPALRAEYDQERAKSHEHDRAVGGENLQRSGLETVDLEDLVFQEETNTWRRPCRCGAAHVVDEAELEKNVEHGELVVGCRGCSLWLRVLFSVEE